MKNIYYKILCLMGISLLFHTCDSFREVAGVDKVQPLQAIVQANISTSGMPVPEVLKVKFVNHNENYEVTTLTDASGKASVGIIPGIYTVSISGDLVHEGFTYYYGGNVVNTPIIADNTSLSIDVSVAKSGAIVFKEIFYSGSKTPSGGSYFRDQYYEFYNNSSEVQYMDGLAFGIIHPMTATATLPNWSAPYDTGDYVFSSILWSFPGNGTDYPLQPGESVIVAQMADNHQKTTLNPTSPVNLLSAEFETLIQTSAIIGDNPAINMIISYYPANRTPQYLTTVFGGGYILIRPSSPIEPNLHAVPIGTTTQCSPILMDDVIDAVEAVNTPSHVQMKRMPSVLDAGAVTVNGTYNTTSIARKIQETLPDGRIIFCDTNNSTEDFEVLSPPVIRRYGSGIPSWNTWKDLQ